MSFPNSGRGFDSLRPHQDSKLYMPLIYVNGQPGSGKSTACRNLKKLGIRAYDIDEDGLAGWKNKTTGEEVNMPEEARKRTVSWYAEHGYMISENKLKDLAKSAGSENIFIFGHSKEDISVIYMFDKIIFLKVDKKTLVSRLANRRRGFGAESDELKLILMWHENLEKLRKKQDAIMVDGSQVPEKVAENILEAAKSE